MEAVVTEQYWVEFRDATDNEVANWAVVTRTADGYPQGQPRAAIQAGDTLIFAIKILSAS